MRIFWFFLAAIWLISASPAEAAPLAALAPIVIGALAKTAVLKIVLTLVATVAVSALQRAMRKKPRGPGISIEQTLTGGINSRSFILGLYCTAGSLVCPAKSQGNAGKTPNAYLTHIVAISDIPVNGLAGLIVNGEYVTVGETATSEYGYPIGGKYAGRAWIKFYDGTQTTADPMLVSKFSSYVSAEQSWTANHVGTGCAYAILTWEYDTDIYKSEPTFKFVVSGIALYDIRKDSTAGGSGSHRWNDKSTWEVSHNPIVQIYNILRGIEFADGTKWGGECEAEDLPFSNWAAAMNVCDETVTTADGTEPRYRAGYEVLVVNDEPADIIEELLNACSGTICEIGGTFKVRAGPPALPVLYVTDKDFLVSRDQDFNPFPAIVESYNSVYATFPHPDEEWNSHDAPMIADAGYLLEDGGFGNQANVSLPTVPYALQVQRLASAWLKDDRRWRRHSAAFGHYAFMLEPIDTIAWTSARNGYSAKVFELDSTTETLMTLQNITALREVDPSDYDWSSADQLPDPVTPGAWELPAVQAVPGWAVVATAITDADAVARRPALLCSWTPDAATDAMALKIQVRVAATEVIIADFTVTNVTDGSSIVSEGILPNTVYQARAMYIVDRAVEWSSWISVTTGNILIDGSEVDGFAQLEEDTEAALEAIAEMDSTIIALQGQANQLESDIIAAQGDISTLYSITSTQGAAITSNATAISNAVGDLANLTTEVRASGNPNFLPNGGFENGSVGWVLPEGAVVYPNASGWGSFLQINFETGALTKVAYCDITTGIPAAGQVVTISGDASATANITNIRFDIYCYDGAGNELAVSSVNFKSGLFNFQNDNSNRAAMANSVTIPAGTTRIRARCRGQASALGTNQYARFRLVKLERGNRWTPYTNNEGITQSFTAISGLNISVATLETTVATQGSSITTMQSAITSLQGNLASLTTKVTASNPNLLPNGSAEASRLGWSGAAEWSVVQSNPVGSYFLLGGAATGIFVLRSDPIVLPAGTYTLAYEVQNSGNAGVVGYCDAMCYDAGGAQLLDSSQNAVTGPSGWGNRAARALTFTAPAGTASIRVRLIGSKVDAGDRVRIRQIKLERGAQWTPYTAEASITQSFSTLSTLTTQYASLSSTVSTQGATITSQQTAINTLNGNMTTAFARVAMTLDVNGHVTGWETNNNGQTGDFTIRSDRFRILPPGGSGDGFYVDIDGSNRTTQYILSGGVRVVEIGWLN